MINWTLEVEDVDCSIDDMPVIGRKCPRSCVQKSEGGLGEERKGVQGASVREDAHGRIVTATMTHDA